MLPGCTPWPADVAASYRRSGYWRGERLGDLTRAWSAREPERVALVTRDRRVTYGELDHRADRLAAALARLGIAAGDRVVVQLPNVPEFAMISLALFRLGALPVYALLPHRRSEIEYLCRHTEAVAYVIPDVVLGFDHRALACQVRATCPTLAHVIVAGDPGEGGDLLAMAGLDEAPRELPPPDPEDVAFFLLSGGTTGLPKLIPRTHDDYAYQLRATAEALGFDERGVYLTSLPVAHNAALGCPGLLGALRAGGRVAMALAPSPDQAFPLIARERVTLTTLVPSLVLLWLETAPLLRADLSGVLLQVGGAMLAPAVAAQVKPVLGCRLSHWFGMAEGLLSFGRLDQPDAVLLSTQGTPLSPADEIRVVDDHDLDVPRGEVGQLITRGPYTLRGYYRAEEHNRVQFTADGFLRSGDLVRIDADGNLVVEGRIKDVVNRGGEKVSAEEVEGHLAHDPAIAAVAIVAMPDPALGERTCAFVVPAGAEPPTLADVRRLLRERGIADYKLPDQLEVIERLPLTSVGKIDKNQLRARAARLVR